MLIIKLIVLIFFLLRFQIGLYNRAKISHSFEMPSQSIENNSRFFLKRNQQSLLITLNILILLGL